MAESLPRNAIQGDANVEAGYSCQAIDITDSIKFLLSEVVLRKFLLYFLLSIDH